LGTARDKASAAKYIFGQQDLMELHTSYKASALVRRAVDLPAEDSCREWREWQAEAADISLIEAEEARLDLKYKVYKARQLARLYGGAAIIIGDGAADPTQPLLPASIGKEGLKYLTVVSRINMNPVEFVSDVTSPDFGKPGYWQVAQSAVRLHPSRVALFHGIEPMADMNGMMSNDGWGDSVLPGMLKSLIRVDEVADNTNSLVYEAKVDVVKIPDFMVNLATRGSAYSDEIIKRVMLAATAKGINGMLLLDVLEEYEQKNASFAGLPDVIDRMMQLASANAGIPMTLLFEMSPAGMQATGDADIRLYYDRVKVEQTLKIQPALAANLDECLIYSALGSRPADLHYNWKPLWQPTQKERAENADKIMSAFDKLNRLGSVPEEAVAKSAVNALTESGAAPGLEGYVEEFYAEGNKLPKSEDLGEEDEPEDVDEGAKPKAKKPVTDAAPRSLYVRRDVVNGAEIIAWAKSQGFTEPMDASQLHVTIAYSKQPVDWMKVGTDWGDEEFVIAAGGPRLMDQFGEATVLLFTSSRLAWRHVAVIDAGGSYDYPDYQPHITISWKDQEIDLSNVKPYQGRIVLGPEIFEEIDEDWKAKALDEEAP
jgi:hypothetical protein